MTRIAICAVLLGACVVACQDYPFVMLGESRAEVTHVREVVVQGSDTDILVVVDNSPSMADEHANLQRNTARFIEELSQSTNKYRVGVITTDLFAAEDGGRLRPSGDGLLFLERPDPGAPDAAARREELIQRFIGIVGSIGTSGGGKEAGLETARRAVDAAGFPEVATHNDGFLRPGADLAIIFLTDEDDCSFPSYEMLTYEPSSCYVHAGEATPAWHFVDALAAVKEDGVASLRAAVIGGGVQGDGGFEPCGCYLTEDGPARDCGCSANTNDLYFCSELAASFGHPCDSFDTCENRCEAVPPSRYVDFMSVLAQRRTEAGLQPGTFADSICRPEYDETLAQIARTLILGSCFQFERPVIGPEGVRLALARAGSDTPRHVPRLDPEDPRAECRSCDECPDGAWELTDPYTVCLACGLYKSTGDEYFLTVVHEEGGVP